MSEYPDTPSEWSKTPLGQSAPQPPPEPAEARQPPPRPEPLWPLRTASSTSNVHPHTRMTISTNRRLTLSHRKTVAAWPLDELAERLHGDRRFEPLQPAVALQGVVVGICWKRASPSFGAVAVSVGPLPGQPARPKPAPACPPVRSSRRCVHYAPPRSPSAGNRSPPNPGSPLPPTRSSTTSPRVVTKPMQLRPDAVGPP